MHLLRSDVRFRRFEICRTSESSKTPRSQTERPERQPRNRSRRDFGQKRQRSAEANKTTRQRRVGPIAGFPETRFLAGSRFETAENYGEAAGDQLPAGSVQSQSLIENGGSAAFQPHVRRSPTEQLSTSRDNHRAIFQQSGQQHPRRHPTKPTSDAPKTAAETSDGASSLQRHRILVHAPRPTRWNLQTSEEERGTVEDVPTGRIAKATAGDASRSVPQLQTELSVGNQSNGGERNERDANDGCRANAKSLFPSKVPSPSRFHSQLQHSVEGRGGDLPKRFAHIGKEISGRPNRVGQGQTILGDAGRVPDGRRGRGDESNATDAAPDADDAAATTTAEGAAHETVPRLLSRPELLQLDAVPAITAALPSTLQVSPTSTRVEQHPSSRHDKTESTRSAPQSLPEEQSAVQTVVDGGANRGEEAGNAESGADTKRHAGNVVASLQHQLQRQHRQRTSGEHSPPRQPPTRSIPQLHSLIGTDLQAELLLR